MADNSPLKGLPNGDPSLMYAGGDSFDYTDDGITPETRGDIVPDDTPPADGGTPPVDDTPPEGDDAPPADDADDDTPPADGADDGDDGADGDGDDDGAGDDGGGDDTPPPHREGSVPKWRLDQQTAKLRQAERELEALRKQTQATAGNQPPPAADPPAPVRPTETPEYKALLTKRTQAQEAYENAIVDGDTAKIKQYREAVDAVTDEMLDFRMQRHSAAVTEEATRTSALQARLDAAATVVQSRFPAMDQNHASYDEDYVHETVAMRNAFMELGRSVDDALIEAAETVAKKYGLTDNAAAAEDPPAAKPPANTKRSKNKAAAAAAQPPKMPGTRNTAPALDLTTVSEKEFDKLSPDAIAKARGDYRV